MEHNQLHRPPLRLMSLMIEPVRWITCVYQPQKAAVGHKLQLPQKKSAGSQYIDTADLKTAAGFNDKLTQVFGADS